MTDWCFSKIRVNYQRSLLILFESGKFRRPVAILDLLDIIAAVREYGQVEFLKELKKFDVEAKKAEAK
jgi:hypothetical protein